MLRKIVNIDESKCNGCGECVPSCAEGAIQVIDGKARLVSDIYCDGLGACLGHCPQDAITVEEREAPDFDEEAAMEHVRRKKLAEEQAAKKEMPPMGGCPGSMARQIVREPKPAAQPPKDLPCGCPGTMAKEIDRKNAAAAAPAEAQPSELTNWPVQLKLVPPTAPYLLNADILLVADCVPFALADFHQRFLRGGKPVLIGCPKLDDQKFYVEKLARILTTSEIKSLTVVHMEVPCCSGLTAIAQAALSESGVNIPARDVTISISGDVKNERMLQ